MNYQHLSQIERYQIYSLMKAQHSITEVAQLFGRNKSTISRELRRIRAFVDTALNRPVSLHKAALKQAEMPELLPRG